MEENNTLLRCEGICKQFNGIPVLKNVDLEIGYGEVHALMGENGAGKSTIIKIITGVYHKDAGQIYMEGKPVEIHSRQDARDVGISVIYQELSLVPSLTVTENIFLGQEKTKFGLKRDKEMHQEVQALIDKYGFNVKPDDVVETLSMARRQIVEILKALSSDAKLIIMDEPTASLSAGETEKLFETIDALRSKGTSILFISHRLDEVERVSDRLTIMRDGQRVGIMEKKDITIKEVTKMMIGHEVRNIANHEPVHRREDHYLEVKDLSYRSLLHDVNFKAYGGEVLGIGGLVGSGRTELIRCIYGAEKYTGSITLDGKPISKSVNGNVKANFGLVPEDRRNQGFIPLLSIEKNIAGASYDKMGTLGFLNPKTEHDLAEKCIKDYDIRPNRRQLPVGNLSGGNQQKVVLGKWLTRNPAVLLLDEPTAGVDVGVKADLYKYIRDLAASGSIVIMVTSDLQELINVSDRILIMRGGKFFEEFTHETATQTAVLMASSGEHTEEGIAL